MDTEENIQTQTDDTDSDDTDTEDSDMKSEWTLLGFETFLRYVIRLKDSKIDFKDCWQQYQNKNWAFNQSPTGVFTPYDANINLLQNATNEFYDVMKSAAERSLNVIIRNQHKKDSKSIIREIFKPFPGRCVSHHLRETEITFQEIYLATEPRFPTRYINAESSENISLSEKHFYKQMQNLIGSALIVNSYTGRNVNARLIEDALNRTASVRYIWEYFDQDIDYEDALVTFIIPVKPPPEMRSYDTWKKVILTMW